MIRLERITCRCVNGLISDSSDDEADPAAPRKFKFSDIRAGFCTDVDDLAASDDAFTGDFDLSFCEASDEFGESIVPFVAVVYFTRVLVIIVAVPPLLLFVLLKFFLNKNANFCSSLKYIIKFILKSTVFI